MSGPASPLRLNISDSMDGRQERSIPLAEGPYHSPQVAARPPSSQQGGSPVSLGVQSTVSSEVAEYSEHTRLVRSSALSDDGMTPLIQASVGPSCSARSLAPLCVPVTRNQRCDALAITAALEVTERPRAASGQAGAGLLPGALVQGRHPCCAHHRHRAAGCQGGLLPVRPGLLGLGLSRCRQARGSLAIPSRRALASSATS